MVFVYLSCIPISRIPEDLLHIPSNDSQQYYVGKKVEFIQTGEELLPYFKTMNGWFNENGKFYNYSELVGKQGVVKWIKSGGYYRYAMVQLDGGTRIYCKYMFLRDYGYLEKTFFIKDFEVAKKLYDGKSIWLFNIVNKSFSTSTPYIFKNIFRNNINQWTNFERFEEVKVIEVIPFHYGHTYAGSPFWLLISSLDGRKSGYIRHDNGARNFRFLNHYYLKNPLKKSWDKEIIQLVKNEKLKIGMTDEQVKFSWGKPDDINTTISVYGTSEQWVYNDQSYLYFEDGILTTIQK